MRKTVTVLAALMVLSLTAKAQFYTHGADPSYLKWYSTESEHYKIIFPQGADSLARVYGTLLEQFREPIGHSIGRTPGDRPRGRKMPVVLHTHNPYSNGSVAWAPMRMDIFTLPEAYGSDPSPWEVQLAAHEPRHQAQLQFGYEGIFNLGNYTIGQGFNPVVWALYLGSPFGEGDAVVAETGLTTGTRARTADFLNYFRIAYDNGDWRTWNRWCYGSFKYYTPDVYKIGYMTIAGGRVFGENPQLVSNLLDHSRKRPLDLAPYNLKAGRNYRKYAEQFNAIWQRDDAARAPFIPQERLTPREDFPVMYSSPVSIDGTMYALREGFTKYKELIRVDGGKAVPIRPFASHTSNLYPEPVKRRLYWTETVFDLRWELDGKSIIRYYDLSTGKVSDLTTEGRLYNPAPSEDGSEILAAEYPFGGGSNVVVVSTADGSILRRIPAPAGLQVTECIRVGGDIYAMVVQAGGYAIYNVDASWKQVLAPMAAKTVDFSSGDSCLEWVSDATGVNEFYRFDLATSKLTRLTSTRYGAYNFCIEGDYLYYIAPALDGNNISRTPLALLRPEEVSPYATHKYEVEDVLTAQENAMGGVDYKKEVSFTETKRYHKFLHPLQIHSWAPLYINYDAVESSSFDFTYDDASLGATLFFQNQLGTLSGSLGYGFHEDPDDEDSWRSALHARLVYTGLYPVIEATADYGDRAASQYYLCRYDKAGDSIYGNGRNLLGSPMFSASVRAYLPLSYSKGGYRYGFIPQVRYSVSNNLYSTATAIFKAPDSDFKDIVSRYSFAGFVSEGHNCCLQSLFAAARGYFMLSGSHSRVYPKYGIGVEAGAFARIGLENTFSPNIYASVYGYVPGLYETHGIRLSGIVQKQLGTGAVFRDVTASIAPRGFSDGITSAIANGGNPLQWRITADYAMPFTICGDLSLMPLLYIRNFVFTPHADFTGFTNGNLWSVGADLAANMGYIFPAAVDATMGISVSRLGGSWFTPSGQTDRWYIGPVFDLSF